jgi:excisionase family DNA binding protein
MTAGLIDRKDAAEYLGVSAGTLANWQSTGFRRVPHVKIGKRVRYRITDLAKFVEQNLVDPVKGDHGNDQ